MTPRCSVCRMPQFDTPGGPCCVNGHGGVDPLEEPQLVTIIAGSRDGPTVQDVAEAVAQCGWMPGAVVSGGARGGDQAGERWAAMHGVPVVVHKAEWNRPDGTIDRGAGHKRNVKMAGRADALIAIWDGKSPGTNHMIQTALARGLRVYVYKPRSAR